MFNKNKLNVNINNINQNNKINIDNDIDDDNTTVSSNSNNIIGKIDMKMKNSDEIDSLFKYDLKRRIFKENKTKNNIHLIIFVHGFQGSS